MKPSSLGRVTKLLFSRFLLGSTTGTRRVFSPLSSLLFGFPFFHFQAVTENTMCFNFIPLYFAPISPQVSASISSPSPVTFYCPAPQWYYDAT